MDILRHIRLEQEKKNKEIDKKSDANSIRGDLPVQGNQGIQGICAGNDALENRTIQDLGDIRIQETDGKRIKQKNRGTLPVQDSQGIHPSQGIDIRCKQNSPANLDSYAHHEQLGNSPALVKVLTKRVFEMIFEEVNTSESQLLIKRKIITPVINMIYIELYPYIIAMILSILTILILSSLTFIGFIFYLIKK